MINLETIARKIDSLLNGTDTEIPIGIISPANDNYFFRVFSEGLYLSDIYDKNAGKNFIPVVVGAYGGENNPVAGLGEQDRNVMVQILFPVRFKQDMYALEEYLDEIIVGRLLTFGSQKAICNLSPAQFGELQDFDFNEFNHWVETNYEKPIEKMETYMSMSFSFYLSTAKKVGGTDGFIYGNSYTNQISLLTKSGNTYTTVATDATPIFVSATDTLSSSPVTQHLLGENYAKGLPQTSAYAKQITLYVKDSTLYQQLITLYKERNYQNRIIQIVESYGLATPITDTKKYYISDMVVNLNKGELMTITLSLGDYLEI